MRDSTILQYDKLQDINLKDNKLKNIDTLSYFR